MIYQNVVSIVLIIQKITYTQQELLKYTDNCFSITVAYITASVNNTMFENCYSSELDGATFYIFSKTYLKFLYVCLKQGPVKVPLLFLFPWLLNNNL